jgi:hypothetical protein
MHKSVVVLNRWFTLLGGRIYDTLTVRLARIVVNAYLENVHLVARTLEAFGDDAAASLPS